ncbi:MAG: hypothetical protein ACYDBJ_26150 [Aggregatilineales bacterium]
MATNFTTRRTYLPEHTRGRQPIYGALVRPLPRKYKGTPLAAMPPGESQVWLANGRQFTG